MMTLEKQDAGMWNGFIWLIMETTGGILQTLH
jgi:hypothetical protein